MSEFDHGPSAQLAQLFDRVPDPPVKSDFWFDWGPVFYRGRLDGSARVLCVASDPGPTERIAGRSPGRQRRPARPGPACKARADPVVCVSQRLGLRRASQPAQAEQGKLDDRRHSSNGETSSTMPSTGPKLQAIIAFGVHGPRPRLPCGQAAPKVTLCEVPHPSSRDETKLLDEWRARSRELRAIVTPDSDGDNGGPNYGTEFSEADYAPIPRRDLPFGAPAFLGDDAWVRPAATAPRTRSSAPRPTTATR